nr:DUF6290 family protein [Mammaliicoccus sp. Marseille-Q6498]
MTTTRITNEETAFINHMVEFLGMNSSDILKRYSLEDLEDLYDAKVGESDLKEHYESNEETIPFEKILDELGVK